jgi:hypothetical protein
MFVKWNVALSFFKIFFVFFCFEFFSMNRDLATVVARNEKQFMEMQEVPRYSMWNQR